MYISNAKLLYSGSDLFPLAILLNSSGKGNLYSSGFIIISNMGQGRVQGYIKRVWMSGLFSLSLLFTIYVWCALEFNINILIKPNFANDGLLEKALRDPESVL